MLQLVENKTVGEFDQKNATVQDSHNPCCQYAATG